MRRAAIPRGSTLYSLPMAFSANTLGLPNSNSTCLTSYREEDGVGVGSCTRILEVTEPGGVSAINCHALSIKRNVTATSLVGQQFGSFGPSCFVCSETTPSAIVAESIPILRPRKPEATCFGAPFSLRTAARYQCAALPSTSNSTTAASSTPSPSRSPKASGSCAPIRALCNVP